MPTEISGSTGVNKIQDGTVVNADINSSAAIAGSKLVMPAGSMLQTVYTDGMTAFASTSQTYVDTPLTVTITPKFTSSKILILANVHMYLNNHSTNAWNSVDFRVVRTIGGSATNVFHTYEDDGTGSDYGYTFGRYTTDAADRMMATTPVHYLDSPNTTSSTTYKIQAHSGASGHNGYVVTNGNGYGISTLTLMEVAG